MKLPTYHWHEDVSFPIRLCLTDSPRPMKPHSQSELELMYFFNTSECRYDCRGSTLSPQSNELIVVNPGEIHACGHWGEGCLAMCLILDIKSLLPHQSQLLFKNLISDTTINDAFEALKRILLDTTSSPLTDCRIFALVYEIL